MTCCSWLINLIIKTNIVCMSQTFKDKESIRDLLSQTLHTAHKINYISICQ